METGTIREQLALLHGSAFGWAMVCCHRDRELAADVLQQAYCRILAGKAKFAGKSDFSTWVFGVIRHVAREEYRRRAKHRTRFQSLSLTETNAPDAHVQPDHMAQRELAEQLWSAMQKLSDRQREVLHLTFYEGMTIEQAAGVIDVSVGTARQHYQRGKAALQRLLCASQEFEK